MTQSLSIATTKQGDNIRFVLSGAMDEDAQYPAITDSTVKTVTFDFAGVDLINSTGLQSWIKFLESVPASADVVFEKCSQRVINQLNLFPGFTAAKKVRIESFFAPYFCETCDASRSILLNKKDNQTQIAQATPPEIKCETCGKPMEFDSIPKKYFLFAKA